MLSTGLVTVAQIPAIAASKLPLLVALEIITKSKSFNAAAPAASRLLYFPCSASTVCPAPSSNVIYPASLVGSSVTKAIFKAPNWTPPAKATLILSRFVPPPVKTALSVLIPSDKLTSEMVILEYVLHPPVLAKSPVSPNSVISPVKAATCCNLIDLPPSPLPEATINSKSYNPDSATSTV